ncbi:hypothetical protein BN1723_017612, partial [Verticillium longisporum]
MDKSINSFNIAICVMNFLNSVFLFMMTNVYAAPDIVPGATGVVLFIANAAFSLILLIMVIISSTIVFWRKNPDAKYQFMADDRVSFMKSQTQLNTTTELDALAATARGDKAGYKSQLDLDDDNESISSESMRRRVDGNGHPLAAQSQTSVNRIGNPPRSPVDPSVPLPSPTVNIVAVSSVQGSVVFDISLKAYGYEVIHRTIDPCDIDLAGLCPMTADKINLKFNIDIDEEATKVIPGIAFSIPDLDATFRAYLNLTETGESVACVEADFSNGKTVDLVGVKWATALIAILGLIAAAVVSGMGHTNAAAHLAANTLSLFGYFQAQAIIGLTGVHLPPVVQAWTQNFMWSMGIIRVGWMQDVFTWYQRATGGEPSTLFNSMRTSSVQVTKRSVDFTEGAAGIMARAGTALAKRANIQLSSGSFIVYGIQRVAFGAKIESTNLFMTGLTFYCIFAVLTVLVVALFKGFTELCVRQRWMKSDSFLEFRNGWLTVLKGILFRVTLIGFPMMTILCLWELTQRDSPAEVVLAIFFFFGMLITLGWASFKVIRIARRSVAMHRNPAYILYSDPQALNKWGFLYVHLFNVVFTPDNGTATVNIVAVSSVQGSVVFDISLKAYGYEVI